jgi:hypothetical protein
LFPRDPPAFSSRRLYQAGPGTLGGVQQTVAVYNDVAGVAGYLSWGAHTSLNLDYAIAGDVGAVQWQGNSRWWIIQTVESFNGEPFTGQGDFYKWFDYRAFGAGTAPANAYKNSPVGAVTYTDEPFGHGGQCNGNGKQARTSQTALGIRRQR